MIRVREESFEFIKIKNGPMPIRRAGDTSFRIIFFFGMDKNNICSAIYAAD